MILWTVWLTGQWSMCLLLRFGDCSGGGFGNLFGV